MIKTPLPPLQCGDSLNGFTVVASDPLPELRSTAVQLRHDATGARVLHLANEDSENLFSINFATPPPDDTGLPHILEHAVLAGSRHYPVREPFFEMLKMSMATFINAMTGWDCTYYPVASNVQQDLFNLAEVYFDAVFHPLLTPQTFRREGHHLTPTADPASPSGLTVSGIVYNEMKGAFSDPESLLHRVITRALFPDTIYRFESGGDPEAIPDLSYEAFLEFHRTLYHPSNAFFIFYGDIPTREYTAFLEPRLADFDRRATETLFPLQPAWTQPRRLEETYVVEPHESLEGKTYLTLHWLAGEGSDPVTAAMLNVLALILLGNDGAPLKKAIIGSHLGEDLVASGDGAAGRQAYFALGIKGSEPDRIDAFLGLVDDCLRGIADNPIDPSHVRAAFRQATYHYLEVLPLFPVHVMDRVLDAWLYGADPLTFLRMGSHLRDCQAAYEADPDIFNRLIRDVLLDNPHRLIAVLRPSADKQAGIDAAFEGRMRRTRATLSDEDMRQLADNAGELQAIAATPNSPEALSTLPQLTRDDLPKQPRHIPTAVEAVADHVTLLVNDVFANTVNYISIAIDLSGLPTDLWPFLPRYIEAIRKLGAAGMNYEQMAQRVASATGGIACRPVLRTRVDAPDQPVWYLELSVKTLEDQLEPALAILRDLLFDLDPRDPQRLQDVLIQTRAAYRTHMVQQGSHTAALHAGRGFSEESFLADLTAGLPQLQLAEQLTAEFDDRADTVMDAVDAIRRFLTGHGRVTVSFTGNDTAAETVRRTVAAWALQIDNQPPTPMPTGFTPFSEARCEGLAGPVQVAHCTRVLPAPHWSHEDEPWLTLAAHLLSHDYMLPEIRFKGNAYGAWFQYGGSSSAFMLGSFRDPHIVETLQVFDRITDHVQGVSWGDLDVQRAIIGTVKNDEKPIRPGEATSLALGRHLAGITREHREQRYARVLEATPAGLKAAMTAALQQGATRAATCVMSNRENLESAGASLDRNMDIRDILQPCTT